METLVRASLIAHHHGLDDEIMKILDTKDFLRRSGLHDSLEPS